MHKLTPIAAGLLAAPFLLRDAAPSGHTFTRTLTLDRASVDEDKRTVAAALSSESEIERFFGREVLVHAPEAVDLSRAVDGLPLLFNHDRNTPIGVVRDLIIEGGRLRGVLHFSNNARAQEVWGDVRDGFLRDVSIGYQIREWTETKDSDLVTVTRWLLFEASVVTIPADQSVGIGRDGEPAVPAELVAAAARRQGAALLTREGDEPAGQYEKVRTLALDEGERLGRERERERLAEITALFEPEAFRGAAFDQLRTGAIGGGWSVDRTRKALLELVGTGNAGPLGGGGATTQRDERSGRGIVTPGDDGLERFVRGAELALAVRGRIDNDAEAVREAREGGFLSMTLAEVAREYLRAVGDDLRGISNRDQLVRRALQVRGVLGAHGTSDFANLLENIANKALLMGWTEAEETWQMIARVGSLPDFRQATRTGLSEFTDLELVYENGEYKRGDLSDRKEPLTLGTYGKLFGLSRQAIVNDDLGAFTMVPRKMGRAAKRIPGDLVYGVLTANAALNQDATALFHANHNNLGTAGAISVATVSELRTLMATQTDGQAAANGLNIPLSRLIVPVALEDTARVLAASEYDPASTTNSRAPNPHRGRFEVVADARLDAADAAQWYGSADPNLYDTLECAFLDGQTEPYLESQDGWTIDGVEYKVRLDCVAVALGYQGLARNAGP